MRIGIDARLPAYQMGGISQYVLHLLPALAEADAANDYFVLHSRIDSRNHTPIRPNFHYKKAYTPCHHSLEKWAFGGEVAPLRLDLLHSPDFIPTAWGARRHVITVHDLNFLYYPHYLTAESRRYYVDQIKWAVERASMISADSEHTRQDLIQMLKVPASKVVTIHLSVNPLYEKAVAMADVDKTLEKFGLQRGFILFVGTIEPRKNVKTLLAAYAELRKRNISVPLVLVGRKGWLSAETFETIDSLNLGQHVRHLQGVSDEPLAHLYHAAGVLALPSHYEGFGLPPLEAMHCNCPVIVSDRGSLPEIVGEAGKILDADVVEDWTGALEDVLNNPSTRESMITAGMVQKTKFSWKTAAEKTLALYKQAMS